MFEEEDEDDEISSRAEELRKIMVEKTRKEFIVGCYDAYDVLTSGESNPKVLEGVNPKSIESAINRMAALFLLREEYERCQFLKEFIEKWMPGFEMRPDPVVEKELKSLI